MSEFSPWDNELDVLERDFQKALQAPPVDVLNDLDRSSPGSLVMRARTSGLLVHGPVALS
jgi:hypothetical protein